MANEKVSQMTGLTAAEIATDDIFLVGDISAHASKKITADQLLTFIESSGSFVAVSSGNADTASYILGSNVDGAVNSSSYSSFVVSASHALRTDLAATASYFSSSVASIDTASYSLIAKTSSYAMLAGNSLVATTAANLSYTGIPNGTASFAISSSNSILSVTAQSTSFSESSSFSITSSFTISSSFSNYSIISDTASYALGFDNPVKAWAMVTWSYGGLYSQPQLYMNYNVNSIVYSRAWAAGNFTWLEYAVTFSANLPSTNYIAVGQAFSPFANPEKQDVIFHPVYSNRTTTTCIIALAVDTATYGISVPTFFSGSSGSFPNGENTYLTFQILGT
jgi:hypothetical protein